MTLPANTFVPALPPIAFIGGGNMASAIIGGLRQQGAPAAAFEVVEPFEAAREQLARNFGIQAHATAGPGLARCALVVWAVKPQSFSTAASEVGDLTRDALQLSVAAGITSGSIAGWIGSDRIVRAMPNTPALIGQGMTGLFARPSVAAADRALVEQVLMPTGQLLWVEAESALDAITAVSGSGPAYVFYFIEAMTDAGIEMGLPADQAQRLAIGTFMGASALAHGASEPVSVLRERVTSKGGTTHAAISSLEAAHVKDLFKTAMHAAHQRAGELGKEFGKA